MPALVGRLIRGVGAGFLLGLVVVVGPAAGSGGPAPGRADPPPTTRAERLVGRHDCWTGAAPAGAPVPSHAVVTRPGRRAQLVDADVGFGIWLDGDPGVLHAFCP